MKILLATLAILSSLAATAATVRITSFEYAQLKSRVAELCGLVEGASTSPNTVRVVVDPRAKGSAVYNSIAGDDGKFCLTVITHTGLAEVSLMGAAASVTATAK